MQNQRISKLWAVARDVISFGLGVFIVLDQEVNQRVNLELLLVALALLGTPGAIALVQLFRGSVEPTRTTEPSVSPPVASSPLPPPSSS